MKLTKNQIEAIRGIAEQLSEAQLGTWARKTERSLVRRELIEKNWLHCHSWPSAGIEYWKLTEKGTEYFNEVLN